MPAQNDQPNLLPIIVIGALLYFFGGHLFRGDQKPPVPTPDDVQPVNPQPDQPTEAEVWGVLADYVAADRLGVLNSHTDHVILIAEELKAMGQLTDISRLDRWRSKREPITAANRDEISRVLRGTP